MTTVVPIENYGPNGLISSSQVTLTGEAEQRYLSPDRIRGAYATLRQWSLDAQNTADIWDTLTPAQKDARMKITYQRLSTFFDRFADLLLVEGRS